jgi:hypothetical protein
MPRRFTVVVCLVTLSIGRLTAADLAVSLPPLDRGFHLLYNLDFAGAHSVFALYEQHHPQDPLGPTSDAAGLLFSEFHRLGVLESQFYEDDKKFDSRPKLSPDPVVRSRFNDAVHKAIELAQARLAKDSKDKNALFAMTLCNGLQADYAALIEKRNLTSLRFTKESVSTSSAAWRRRCAGWCAWEA